MNIILYKSEIVGVKVSKKVIIFVSVIFSSSVRGLSLWHVTKLGNWSNNDTFVYYGKTDSEKCQPVPIYLQYYVLITGLYWASPHYLCDYLKGQCHEIFNLFWGVKSADTTMITRPSKANCEGLSLTQPKKCTWVCLHIQKQYFKISKLGATVPKANFRFL